MLWLLPSSRRDRRPVTAGPPRTLRAHRRAFALRVLARSIVALAAVGLIVSFAVTVPSDDRIEGLVVRTDAGNHVLDLATGQTEATLDADVLAPDQRVAYRTSVGRSTVLRAVTVATGQNRWTRTIDGELEVRLATNDEQVVLASPGGDTYAPVPRSRTTIVVVDRTSDEPQVHELRGNYEPEALSTDGTGLFVIAYTPPLDPQTYQVRRLDLTTGEVGPVFTPDAHLQEEMGGTARTQVGSADGQRLYTLYTHTTPDGTTHAFVHVLDLEEQWAHCILLPEGTGLGSPTETAIALAPDGQRLYIADHAAQRLVEVDTEGLTVSRTTPLSSSDLLSPEVSLAASEDGLALGSGPRVTLFDRTTLEPTRRWWAPAAVVDVAAGTEAFYVATRRSVSVLPRTEEATTHGVSSELGEVRGLGAGTHATDTTVVCAC